MKTDEIKKSSKRIPLLDLKSQYKSIKGEINAALKGIIDEQNFIMGEDVKLLEKDIAQYCGTKFAVAVSSGTDALILALKAIDIKNGDEVITTPFTFIATGGAIINAGGVPVFCDIDPDTYNIEPKLIEKKINRRTKAIMPVHLYGQCANMDEILKIAKAYNIKVIEDTAQAIGATYKGKKAASIGDIGCISFFPSKNLGAYGDGGMVVTDNEKYAEKVSLLRVHGSKTKYVHSIIGTNARLDNLQAAVLRVKLNYLDEWAKKRAANAQIYNNLLEDTELITPFVPSYNVHVYHQYVVRLNSAKRDSLIDYLNTFNVESRVYYPIPLHLQECFKYLGYASGNFLHSEEAANSTIVLPVYPELTREEISYVAKVIKSFLAS